MDNLITAIKNGDATTAADIIKGIDVNGMDGDDNSALLVAANFNRPEIAGMLIKKGADINKQNSMRETALYIAASYGFEKLAYVLIDNGADVNLLNKGGYSPIMGAASKQMEGVVKRLIEKGAKINIVDSNGHSALIDAVYSKNVRIVQMLLENGAKPDLCEHEALLPHNNPLNVASKEGYLEIVKLLVKHGADTNARHIYNLPKSKNYKSSITTPLHLAAENGHFEIVKFLAEHGADIEAKDNKMETPLFKAIDSSSLRDTLMVVEYLVEHGADIETKDAENFKLKKLTECRRGTEAANYLYDVYQKKLGLGKNRIELFDAIIRFSDIEYSAGGMTFWEGTTAEDCKLMINGISTEIPKGTWITRGLDFIMVLPKDIQIRVGQNTILFARKEALYVSWKEGSGLTIEDGVPAKDMILMVGNLKIPFVAKRYEPFYAAVRGQASITFHKNGTVSEGYVGRENFTLKVGQNELTFKGNKIMKFHEDGSISEGEMADNTTLTVGKNKIPFFSWRIACYANGNIRSGQPSQNVSLPVGKDTVEFQKGAKLSFHENGSVESGTILKNVSLTVRKSTVEFQKGTKIYFYKDGSIEQGTTLNEIAIKVNGRKITLQKQKLSFRTKAIWKYLMGAINIRKDGKTAWLSQSSN